MHIDIIIGNPPYQESTGGGNAGGVPLYTHFVTLADRLNAKYFSYIMPTRWYIDTSRKSSADLRHILLNKNTKCIVDIEDASNVFNGVQIAGGVCYFLKDTLHEYDYCTVYKESIHGEYFECILNENRFIRDSIAYKVYNQVLNNKERVLSDIAFSMNVFGLKRSDIGNIDKMPNDNIEILSSCGIGYCNIDFITRGTQLIDKYKVLVGYGPSSYDTVIKTRILKPGQVCTLTYLVIATFDTLEQALEYERYVNTKFIRYMIRAAMVNQSMTSDNLVLAPLLELNINDKMFYTRYGLTDIEINKIEASVKVID